MSATLRPLWLRGVAFNPAAPSDVLIRLMDPAAGETGTAMCQGRDLPGAALDAALRHPDRAIRGALARNHHVDPRAIVPLAKDPSGLVRAWLADGPRPRAPRRVRPLPDEVLVTLLTAEDGGEDGRVTASEIVGGLDGSGQVPLSFRHSLAERDHPELRIRATWSWGSLTPEQRAKLLDDPDPAVRQSARDRRWVLDPEQVEARLPDYEAREWGFVFGGCALTPAMVERCFADDLRLTALAGNRHTPDHALARLARHPEARFRALVATRPDLAPELVAELREDPHEGVRELARVQPFSRTWAEHDVIGRIVGHGRDCVCPITEFVPRPPADWFAACAVSGEPVLRRVAASWPGLPAALAAPLAEDEDEEVRIRLACHHPLAPPRLLLDVFVAHPVHRPHLLTLPAFPRTGTAHLVGHPDPRVRAVAAGDPALSDPPVTDADPAVRRAAAANPGLSPEVLEVLLADPDTAEGAAANPSLPVARMHALLDDCLGGAAPA
ncbi:hypothetical protein ACIQNV_28800 [Streptomyces hydrogenans]|uniref:hypothetical protein n=1 Tax=Streptomyces hydrogenans TaxID=1873719 RepID=UPI0038084769